MPDANRKHIDNGFFISLEGAEGAGKSTQAKRLAELLESRGYDVHLTREPGGTPLGEELRRLLKHVPGDDAPCPEAELLLMAASRAQLVRQVILPFLHRGGIVVCDRFADSTTVYQGYVRNLDSACIESLHELATAGRWPDITLLLDVDTEAGLQRTRVRAETGQRTDRFEREPYDFHRRVREGFLKLAEAHRDRIRVVAAEQSEEDVHKRIAETVLSVLEQLQ